MTYEVNDVNNLDSNQLNEILYQELYNDITNDENASKYDFENVFKNLNNISIENPRSVFQYINKPAKTNNQKNSLFTTKQDLNIREINAVDNNKSKQDKPVQQNYSTVNIKSDDELYKIIGNEIKNNSKASINYIADVNDLAENNLTDKYTVTKNSDNTSKLNHQLGLLVTESKEPVILVIDYRKIPNTVEFNSLYDIPPTWDDKTLAKNVRIVSIINNELSTVDGHGQDFWRRVFHTADYTDTNSYTYLKSDKWFQSILEDKIKDIDNLPDQNTNSVVVKLASENWYHKLFGHLDIDEQSNICYKDGKLAKLQKNQTIYLKDAPWDDLNFSIAIDKILKEGGYVANGEFIKLPSNIKFVRGDTKSKELKILQNKFKWDIHASNDNLDLPGKVKILNENSFFSCIQKSTIKNGKLIKRDVFKDWLGKNTSVIRVTTKLSPNQWLTLLAKLEKLGRTDIYLIQDDSDVQPMGWKHENNFEQKHNSISKNIKIVQNDNGLIPDVLAEDKKNNNDALDIQLSPDCYIGKVISNIKSISMKNHFFDIENTEFYDALKSGRLINIYGLEDNPRFVQEVETLLGNPPHLIVNGLYTVFPKAKINFHLPESFNAPTKLWKKLKSDAKEVYKDTLNTIKTRLYKKYAGNIEQKLSNKIFNQVISIVNKINNLPKTNKSPQNNLIISEALFDKLWEQAIVEQKLDGIKKINDSHFMKSLNSILSKRYRDEPETYRYIKFLINKNFSITPQTFDLTGLKNWIRTQKKITPQLIQDNFWQISEYIPFNRLKLKKTKFNNFFEIFTLKNIKNFFTINNLILGLKKLKSAAIQLLGHILWLPIYLAKAVLKIIKQSTIILSRIVPWMETRVYLDEIKQEKTPEVSLKDLAIAGSEALDFVNTTIVACIDDEKQRKELQDELGISTEKVLEHKDKLNKYINNCYKAEKILRDICYSVNFNSLDAKTRRKIEAHGYQKLCHDLSIGISRKLLELEQTKDENKETTKACIINEISEVIAEILPGNQDKDKQERLEIAEDLLLMKGKLKYLVQRRKVRFAEKVKVHKMAGIRGYAGAGKSYVAKQIAKMLNPNEDPVTINIKANMSADDLYGSFKLENDELKHVKSEFCNWAERKGEGYHILILDEYNLTKDLLDSLRTIKDNPPYINIDGKKIFLTDKHRIIFTGNPDYVSGRKPNKILDLFMVEMFYLPLDENFQREQIIEPEVISFVDRIQFSNDIGIKNNAVNKITTCINDLYSQYKKLIPSYEFTPRDLTDCCSRMETYFSDYITGKKQDEITLEMINSVARAAMQETVANSISGEYAQHLEAINIWHTTRFASDDKIVAENENGFKDFYDKLELFLRQHKSKQYNNFDLTNEPTKIIFKTIYRELTRISLELETNTPHKGRRAVLIEGMPGIGKDTINAIMIEFWQHLYGMDFKYEHLSATTKTEGTIADKVQKKHKDGGILSVSEINSIKTENVEGHMNDLFTLLPSTPGFLVLMTINSVNTVKGRNKFSPALLSRLAKNLIPDHTFNDLKNICKKRIDNENYANLITKLHWKVRFNMKQEKRSALPSIADIEKIVAQIHKSKNEFNEDLSIEQREKNLLCILKHNYSKYLQLLDWNNKKINDFFTTEQINEETIIETSYIKNLTQWINQQVDNNLNAIVVDKGIITNYDTSTGILTLSQQDQEKTETEKQKIILNVINDTPFEDSSTKEKFTVEHQEKDEVKTKIEKTSNSDIPYTTTDAINIDFTDISADEAVDADVEKILNRTYYSFYNLEGEKKNFLSNKFLKSTEDNLRKIISDHVNGKIKPVSGITMNLLLHWGKSDAKESISNFDYKKKKDSKDIYSKSIKFLASKERTNLVKKTLIELKNSQFLQQQLQTSCIKNKHQESDFWNFFNDLATSNIVLEIDETNIVNFNILAELNGSACSKLYCAMCNFVGIYAMDMSTFTDVLAKGYISYNTAIKFIENKNAYKIKMRGVDRILSKCCETLKAGKNINNISAIAKYLMRRDGNYFSENTLYNLINISKMNNTLKDLANEAERILDAKYKLLLQNDLVIPAGNYKQSEISKQYENISSAAAKKLKTVINNSLDNMIKTDTETKERFSWNPSVGNVDIGKFLERKAPFKERYTQSISSKDIIVLDAPSIPSIRLSTIFYHKPTDQLIDLFPFLTDDQGKLKDLNSDLDIADDVNKYLKKIGINNNVSLMLFLLTPLFKNLFDTKEVHGFYHGGKKEQHEFFSEQISKINSTIKGYDSIWEHIPSTVVTRLVSQQMLNHAGKIKYCLKFNNSSQVGSVTVKNQLNLRRVDDHCENILKDKFLLALDTCDVNKKYYGVEQYEKTKVRDIIRNDNALVLNKVDIEGLVTEGISDSKVTPAV